MSKPDWIKQLEKAVGEIPTTPGQLTNSGLTPSKARQILHDGRVRGHPLTDRQRRYMGAVASGHVTSNAASIQPADIRTVCCVCGAHVSGDSRARLVSHGYCQPCGQQAIAALGGTPGQSKTEQSKKTNPQLQLLMNGHMAKSCYNCGHALTQDQDVCPVCWAGQTDENPCHENPGSSQAKQQLTGAETRSLNAGYRKFHGVDGSKSQTWGCPGEKHYKLWLCGRVPGVSWGHGTGERCSGCREQKMTVQNRTHEWTGHRLVFSGEARPYLCVDLESRELVLVKGDLSRLDSQELGPAPLIEYTAPKGSNKGPYHYVHATKLGYEPSLVCDSGLGGYRYVGGVYSVEDWLHD